MPVSRLLAHMALAAGLLSTAAKAGDFATFVPLGFSEDGHVFAFEEYGVQDGSGFAYSNIFFIDTERDTFLEGSPYRIRLEDESATIGDARAAAAGEALERIREFALLDHPGWLAAFNAVTDITADASSIRYQAHPNLSAEYELKLDDFPLEATSACAAIAPEARGFSLSYRAPDGQVRTLHKDDRIPASRNCALGYRLGGVMTYLDGTAEPVHVALVTVLSQGFEGPDGRWIAVPFRP